MQKLVKNLLPRFVWWQLYFHLALKVDLSCCGIVLLATLFITFVFRDMKYLLSELSSLHTEWSRSRAGTRESCFELFESQVLFFVWRRTGPSQDAEHPGPSGHHRVLSAHPWHRRVCSMEAAQQGRHVRGSYACRTLHRALGRYPHYDGWVQYATAPSWQR